ncbi:uncharacterized protein RHO25_007390 [Cercospora beticola]|uniref:VOC domain-containing protein n=1 Tax=Cercospora beticola TaxID=122368 RepID=A0ABZ0NT59_CERBT|nr:hypothetical protein RHO25_007390 [Cercospora beticola]CAK1358568.1 unnamed protein product [Cercospora beticola]
MPLDHHTFVVPQVKLDQLVNFLVTAFASIGLREVYRASPSWTGIGDKYPFLWLHGTSEDLDEKTFDHILKESHVCFRAENREQVHAFHAAAIISGGICNGPPGFRRQFAPTYYAAYILDPFVGVNWEVVTHAED